MGDEVDIAELDWLDQKLREEAPYIDDAGFTSQVMQKVPVRRATRSLRALILLLSAVFASVGAYFLSGGGRFIFEALARAELLSPIVIYIAAALFSVCFSGLAMYAAFRRIEAL